MRNTVHFVDNGDTYLHMSVVRARFTWMSASKKSVGGVEAFGPDHSLSPSPSPRNSTVDINAHNEQSPGTA